MNLKSFLLCSALYCLSAGAQQSLPVSFPVENTAPDVLPPFPDVAHSQALETLTDPFLFSDGSARVKTFAQWQRRRGEIVQELQHYEIGVKPVVPRENISARLVGNRLSVSVWHFEDTLTLNATIRYPKVGSGPFPLIIAISRSTIPDSLMSTRPVAILEYQFQQVNSYTQFGGAAGRGNYPFDRLYPYYQQNGAYSEWAWGVSRFIDALQILGPEVTKIDTGRLGICGCSFAGKMALFAGALDERIALTIAQESGGGGVATWRYSYHINSQSEKPQVEAIDNTDYNWFLQQLKDNYGGDSVKFLPYDHHELVTAICPRAILVLGNTDYPWLSDPSAYVSVNAAQKVWQHFNIADRIGYCIEGGHPHCMFTQTQARHVAAYIDKFLLGKDNVDTNVHEAPADYANIPVDYWTQGWK